MSVILEARRLNKSFGAVTAAADISVGVQRDSVVGLIGSNGAGKTTFINMVTGYLAPTSGEFVFVAILAGTGNVLAPFLGAFIFETIRSFAYEYSPNTWQMALGISMLIVIMFLPGGLWSLFTRVRKTA